jgi:hypothetical protein
MRRCIEALCPFSRHFSHFDDVFAGEQQIVGINVAELDKSFSRTGTDWMSLQARICPA